MGVLEKIERTRKSARESLDRIADERTLEDWRIEFLGRKSETVSVLRSLGDLDSENRRAAGQAANALKIELEEAFRAKLSELAEARLRKAQTLGRIDVTLPPRPLASGRRHPISQTQRDIVEAFVAHWDAHRAVLRVRNLASEEGDARFLRVRRRVHGPVIEAFAEQVRRSQAAGRVAPEIHPYAAAAALAAILERLAAYHSALRALGVTREHLVETSARILLRTLTGTAA